MAKGKLFIEEFIQQFKSPSEILIRDIKEFYENVNAGTNYNTIKYRINALVKKGVIKTVGRGIYAIGKQNIFVPQISEEQKQLHFLLSEHFPHLTYCLWNTSVFNEFMLHQPAKFYTIVEVESDNENRLLYAQSVFNYLKDNNLPVFITPDSDIVDNYITQTDTPIIVIQLVSEAPTKKIDNILTITIEKMLVDILCDKNIFAAQQGSETFMIFENAIEKYTINRNALLRYAKRRNKQPLLIEILEKIKSNTEND